jgi:hypothetical protein
MRWRSAAVSLPLNHRERRRFLTNLLVLASA